MQKLLWVIIVLVILVVVALGVGSVLPPSTDLAATQVTPDGTELLVYSVKSDRLAGDVPRSLLAHEADAVTIPVVLDSLVSETGPTTFAVPPLKLTIDVRRTLNQQTGDWWLLACMVHLNENGNFTVSAEQPVLVPHIGASLCGLRFQLKASRTILAGLFGLGGQALQQGHCSITARTDGVASLND
jgi:hypothetical protein